MGTTPRLGLPFPEPQDPADVPADLQALAGELDGKVFTRADAEGLILPALAETTLRLWQLEADVIAETEGFAGWTGEAFLTNQNNVASVVGDVSVARAARLGGGGLSIAASPILGLVPGDPLMGGFFAGVIDPNQVPYDSGEAYPDDPAPRYALIVGPKSLESATGQTWSSNTSSSVSGTRTWWDGLRASEALIAGGHSIGTWLSNLRSSNPVPADDGSDWYIPSLGELSLIYQNLKPGTDANYTAALTAQAFPAQQALSDQGDSWGPYGGQTYYTPVSEPPFQGYGTSNPSQTPASAFQLGGAQALDYDADSRYWTSTEAANDRARGVNFRGSLAGIQGSDTKTNTSRRARPVRRVVL